MKVEDLNNELMIYNPSDIIFVGIGNELRDDDLAGLELMEEIRRVPSFKTSHFIRAGRTPENYLQEILAYEGKLVVFIDSVHGSEEGEFILLSENDIEQAGMSTHSFSLRLIEKYLKAEQDLNCKYIGVPV